MTGTTCEVSVVLPCLDEAESLAICIDKAKRSLRELGVVGEIVIADNGSTDGSKVIALEHGAVVVEVPKKGYGSAIMGGIQAARGTYIIMADADDTYELDNLGPFIDKLRGGSKLVMGNRFKGGIAPGAMPNLHQYLGNPVLSWIGRLFFGGKIGDFHCGLRGFDRAAILGLDLRTTGMEFASELVVKSAIFGLSTTEVPTTLRPDRRSRAPHLRTWHDGWRHLRFLLIYSPRWLFLYPGLLLLVVGLVGTSLLLPGALTVGRVTFDLQALTFACLAMLTGVQSLWFAVLAKSIAISEGLLPWDRTLYRFLQVLSPDRLLLGGTLLGMGGLVGLLAAVFNWGSKGFGPLDVETSLRTTLFATAAAVLGLQAVFGAFLLSLIQIKVRAVSEPSEDGPGAVLHRD